MTFLIRQNPQASYLLQTARLESAPSLIEPQQLQEYYSAQSDLLDGLMRGQMGHNGHHIQAQGQHPQPVHALIGHFPFLLPLVSYSKARKSPSLHTSIMLDCSAGRQVASITWMLGFQSSLAIAPSH